MIGSDSPILELKTISKRFGSLLAVNNVSFSLERGRLVTFLGPSGCGKTTLLRVVSGFAEPDEGEVILDGQNVTRKPPNARDTAMVFQNYALFPHMTVAQNIGFGMKIRKKSQAEIDGEVKRLLALVKMEGLGERRPHELSGGQQQRVALARALSLHPKILLLDEPLSNLDANLRVNMREEIRRLQRRLGLTIIFVTHDQEEAMSISDLLVVMDQGVVKQVGSPTEIYEKPADEFVANFIGHINFFAGEVIGVSTDHMNLQIAQGRLKVKRPFFPVGIGDKVKLVVRPESIDLVDAGNEPIGMENVIEGRIEVAMYIGSIIRYSIRAGEQIIYVDSSDPQYAGIFQEGSRVKLVLKEEIHMFKTH
jgi:spermidine/putrescine ABC transporter ATP-binding subunit